MHEWILLIISLGGITLGKNKETAAKCPSPIFTTEFPEFESAKPETFWIQNC